jgi:beta-galactosidase
VIQKGTLELDIPPGEAETIRIPIEIPDIQPETRYYLLLQFTLPEKTIWADKGHEIAWEQFELPWFSSSASGPALPEPALEIEKSDEAIGIRGKDFYYVFDTGTGSLVSMTYRDVDLLSEGPAFNVWRAPLANELDAWGTARTDIGQRKPGMGRNHASGWRAIGLDKLAPRLEEFMVIRELENRVELRTAVSLSSNNHTTGFDVSYHYLIHGDGRIEIKLSSTPHGNMTHWLPKIGLQMQLPKTFQVIEWHGRGPFESYPDRKTGARFGFYQTTVEEAYVPYIIPQDHGNRTDVHWMSLTSNEGIGLFVTADELFHFSAQKHDPDNLDRSYYAFQLKEGETITLNLDHRVTGVGCTAISVMHPYRVLPAPYVFSFTLTPYSSDEISPAELAKLK